MNEEVRAKRERVVYCLAGEAVAHETYEIIISLARRGYDKFPNSARTITRPSVFARLVLRAHNRDDDETAGSYCHTWSFVSLTRDLLHFVLSATTRSITSRKSAMKPRLREHFPSSRGSSEARGTTTRPYFHIGLYSVVKEIYPALPPTLPLDTPFATVV